MSGLRLLRTLVTERLTAAAEEILVLVERVMVEHEEGLIRLYRPEDVKRSPDREQPQSRGLTDAQQLDGFDLQQQPDEEQPEPPAIKQEQEEEEEQGEEEEEQGEVWSAPEVQAEAPQMMEDQDTKGFIYSLECKSEQPQVDSADDMLLSRGEGLGGQRGPSGGLRRAHKDTRVNSRGCWGGPMEIPYVQGPDFCAVPLLPSTSSEPGAPQFGLPAAPPPAAAQSKEADGASCCCKVCGMMFSYRGSLLNHAEIHADDEHCLCGVCGRLLPDRENLLEHLQTHVKVHVCQFCGKTFRRNVDLAVHTRCHTGEKPFSCRVCGKGFSRKGNMAIHMRTHTGEKPYRCGVCGKCFNITSSMIRHSRTHSGEKPYSCHFCFKGFTNSSDMKIHMRTHTGEKPYTCPVCGKGFPLSTPLKYHMKHHTEERPYCCSECSRCFSDVYTLRRHMKTHGEDKAS